jgi:hypothetical protein
MLSYPNGLRVLAIEAALKLGRIYFSAGQCHCLEHPLVSKRRLQVGLALRGVGLHRPDCLFWRIFAIPVTHGHIQLPRMRFMPGWEKFNWLKAEVVGQMCPEHSDGN